MNVLLWALQGLSGIATGAARAAAGPDDGS